MQKSKFIIVAFLSVILMMMAGFVATTAWAEITRDAGNVAIIEHDGTKYDDKIGGAWNITPRERTATEFYENHGDYYDFLCVISNFEYDMLGGEEGFYLNIQQHMVSGLHILLISLSANVMISGTLVT